jgi:aminoglycoside phosphotransferase (APT) family kinase protein
LTPPGGRATLAAHPEVLGLTTQSIEDLIDVPALQRFVDEHVPGGTGDIEVQKHVAGFSNETFYVSRGAERWVLRRPPRGPLLPTAHDVVREYRFISALHGRARVPAPVAVCETNDVIGAPFYLMERCDGVVIREVMPPAYDTVAGRVGVANELVDALVELHAVDSVAAGVGGKGESYLERQLARWSKQWELTRPRTRELPGLDSATAWLKRRLPPPGGVSVVHGDYKLDNVMYANDAPKLIAIFDWEMATVGDPLADLGWLLSTWGDPGDPPPPPEYAAMTGGRTPLTAGEGFPALGELAARYEAKSGRSMRDFAFFHVLAVYKLAIILEGLYMHYLEATASNPESARFEFQVPMLIDRAHRIMGE